MTPADEHARPPGLSVYIHWPFCAQKCPYCDFNSHVRHGGWDESRFLSAYKRELDHVARMVDGAPPSVTSIFFGGGTPSLMQPSTVSGIIDHIAKLWRVAADAEITLEANPNSVEASRFAGYRSAGVNRVSIGVQSLRDEELRRLGRLHSVSEARSAIDIAARNFDRYSFDLIYARPDQSVENWRDELSDALALAGGHLSLYQLTIEEGTPYFDLHARGRLVIPDDDAARDLYALTGDMTRAAGLPSYEVSNYAAPGQESRHNLAYWRYEPYAGIGPGAHGRLHQGLRYLATSTERQPERWLGLVEQNGHGFVTIDDLTLSEQADEMLLMGLRLADGLDLDAMTERLGVRPADETIVDLQNWGLIDHVRGETPFHHEDDGDHIRGCLGPGLAPAPTPITEPRHGRIRATRDGMFVLDALVRRLSAALVVCQDSKEQIGQ